jgi:hypothetical protein
VCGADDVKGEIRECGPKGLGIRAYGRSRERAGSSGVGIGSAIDEGGDDGLGVMLGPCVEISLGDF